MTVLLHGFTGAPRSFEGLSPMLAVPGALAPPLLGHGAAAASVSSFDGELDRIAAIISEAVPRGARWVVGYSLGGRIALGLAARHSELIDGVIAIGAHPGLADIEAGEERRRHDDALADEIGRLGVPHFVDRWEQAPLFLSQRALPAALQASQRGIRLSHDEEGLARSLQVLGLGAMPNLRPALARTDVPVHLVTGALDEKFSAIARGLVGATSHTIIDGAGHNVVLEQPEALAELINAAIPARGRASAHARREALS